MKNTMNRLHEQGAVTFPRRIQSCALLLAVYLVSGCAGTPVSPEPEPSSYLYDEAFPKSAEYEVESRRDIFELDADAKNYLDERIGHLGDSHSRNKALIDEIIQQAARKLSYTSNANTTASETFETQAANCLSMSIMTYAMATYLGYEGTFRVVDTPDYWERRSGHNLLARHVNLLLRPGHDEPGGVSFDRAIEVDFFAPGSSRRFRTEEIPAATVVAMFYNNKSADALLAGNYDVAYAYLRAALLEDPSLGMAISNLGALYRATGHLSWAEKAFRAAVRLDADSTVPLEGLGKVLRDTGRHEEAETILAEVKSRRMNNPYYHYVQGEAAYDAGQWPLAIRYFHKAIDLKPDIDPPYFGLAKTYFQMGDKGKARAYLKRAAREADHDEQKERYRSKIDALAGSMP